MRRAAALGALIGSLAAPAAAAPGRGARQLDGDAEVVLRLAPAELGGLAAELARLNGVNALLLGLGRKAARRLVGWDLLAPGDWSERGVDAARPIYASLAVDRVAGGRRYVALARSAVWEPRVLANLAPALWRLRVVLPVTDRGRAVAALLALPGVSWSREAWWRTLGASGRPRRRDVLAAGHAAALDLWIVVRGARGSLVIDVLRPMFSDALHRAKAPPPSASALLGAARTPPPKGSLAGADPAAWPDAGGAALWIDGQALVAVGRAWQQEMHVAYLAADPDRRGGGAWRANPRCASLAEVADGKLLTDASLRLASRPDGFELDGVLGATSDEALAAALPRASAPLVAHRTRGAVAWAALWNGPTAGLRALDRPEVYSSWPLLGPHLRGCEDHYVLTAELFGWPQMTGLFLDEMAALGPRGKLFADTAAGAAASVRRWSDDPLKLEAVIEGTVEPRAAGAASSLLDRAFLPGDRKRPLERWGRGRLRPYVRHGAARTAVGTTLGGLRGARWFHGGGRRPPARWLAGDELAAGWIDLDASLPALRRWVPALGQLQGISEVRGRVWRRGRRLVARFDLER